MNLIVFFILLYFAIFLITILLLVWFGFKLYVMTQGPQFVPCQDERLKNALALARIKIGDKVVDLGSGDGKVLIACAKRGAVCTGFEIDPLLVIGSRNKIKKLGLQKQITIKGKSFWDADLKNYDIVFIYVVTRIIKRLLPLLQKRVKKNTRIISVYCQFPGIPYQEKKGDVYLYRFSKNR